MTSDDAGGKSAPPPSVSTNKRTNNNGNAATPTLTTAAPAATAPSAPSPTVPQVPAVPDKNAKALQSAKIAHADVKSNSDQVHAIADTTNAGGGDGAKPSDIVAPRNDDANTINVNAACNPSRESATANDAAGGDEHTASVKKTSIPAEQQQQTGVNSVHVDLSTPPEEPVNSAVKALVNAAPNSKTAKDALKSSQSASKPRIIQAAIASVTVESNSSDEDDNDDSNDNAVTIPSPPDISKFSITPPKNVVVKASTVPGAGEGLFLLQSAKKGDRVALYSGDLHLHGAHANSSSVYLLQVNKTAVLDAADDRHAAGRKINCALKAGKQPNVHFQANLRYQVCPKSGVAYQWVFAKQDIDVPDGGEVELFADYGGDYWGGYIYVLGKIEDGSTIVQRLTMGSKIPKGFTLLDWLDENAYGFWPCRDKEYGWVQLLLDKKHVQFHWLNGRDTLYITNPVGKKYHLLEAEVYFHAINKADSTQYLACWEEPATFNKDWVMHKILDAVKLKRKYDKFHQKKYDTFLKRKIGDVDDTNESSDPEANRQVCSCNSAFVECFERISIHQFF